MVVIFHLKPMRTNPELAERDPEGMHPMAKCIGQPDNEATSHLHDMFNIKSHLGLETMRWIHPDDLNVLFVNVFPNDPI
jgi:hypothetical protein